MARLIEHATAARRVVLLDCCYSALALPGSPAITGPSVTSEAESAPAAHLLGVAKIEGTWMPAATQRFEQAQAQGPDECTAFTGELVRILRDGITPGTQDAPEFLSLNAVHQAARKALRDRQLPEPERRDHGGIGQKPHFQNSAARQAPHLPDSHHPPDSQGPHDPVGKGDTAAPAPRRRGLTRRRSVLIGGIAVVAVVLGVLFAVRPWAPSLVLVPGSDGVSMTQYCAGLAPQGAQGTQGFTVAGTDCTQTINLDKACDYQYRETGLVHEFTNPADPHSAICFNPATKRTYFEGITKMAQYCTTLTATSGVTATYLNPDYKNTWVCQVTINMNLACDEQYDATGLVARQDTPGYWNCYEYE